MLKHRLEFLLALDDSKFNKALKASRTKVTATSKAMASALKPAAKGFANLASSVSKVGVAAAAVMGAGALYGLNRLLHEAVDLAMVQDAAENKLAAVIRATGEAAGFSSAYLVKYAGDLQQVTTYGDETTISALAVLATFKEIKGDNFKAAAAAAQDMSAVLGTDLQSSVLQIGKALNDPIKGVSALTRSGVSFTESQKAMIKTLQESGNLLGAQKIILKELSSEFGGAAAAARKTFGGSLTAAKNALGDLKEQIGFSFTKNSALITGIQFAEQQFIAWTGEIKKNETGMKQWAVNSTVAVLGFSSSAVQAGATAIGMFVDLTKTLRLSYTSVMRLASGYLYYRETMYSLVGAEDKANAQRLKRLNIQYDIEQSYEDIAAADEAAAKAKGWAETAAAKIEELKDTIENADIDPSEAIDDSDSAVKQKLVKIGATWVNVTETAAAKVQGAVRAGMEDSAGSVSAAGEGMVSDWGGALGTMEQETSSTVDAIIRELERLQQAKAAADTGYSTGGGFRLGGIIRAALGGKLPGYGGGDRRLFLLEDGEFIIRKEAVSRFGDGVFHALNNLRLPALPGFATGGPVASAASPSTSTGSRTIRLDLGLLPGQRRVSVWADRQNALALAGQFEAIARGSSS